ncbi:unnamed protein product [Ranitomeya imitator]|uniref:Uncharacterized protein n=1 Tax=Ranitomeya imitator TaxID=111125 RepID=A0ABN9KUG4_9NEOB|nr:unnamed protein product [Ranitomeya imitator]
MINSIGSICAPGRNFKEDMSNTSGVYSAMLNTQRVRSQKRIVVMQFSMVNFTSISENCTLMSTYIEWVDAVTRSALAVFTLLIFTFFLYIISVLLKVFFSNPHIWEKSRYILFVHMLINDTLYLALGNFILVTAMYSVHFPVSVCFMLHTLATCCFRVTPYNLAVMSLERYTPKVLHGKKNSICDSGDLAHRSLSEYCRLHCHNLHN